MKNKRNLILTFCCSCFCVFLLSIAGIFCEASAFTVKAAKESKKEDVAQYSTKTLELENTSPEELTIKALDCNIMILESDDDNLHCTYNSDICDLTLKEKENEVYISYEALSDACQDGDDIQVFNVYLPKKLSVKTVNVSSKHAGITIVYFPDSDLHIKGKKGSVSYIEPEDFKHTISVEGEDSVFSAVLLEAEEEDVNIQGTPYLTKYPRGWEKTEKDMDYRITYQVTHCAVYLKNKLKDSDMKPILIITP